MLRKPFKITCYVVGWSALLISAAAAFLVQFHGGQFVSTSVAAAFVVGLLCLWIGSEL